MKVDTSNRYAPYLSPTSASSSSSSSSSSHSSSSSPVPSPSSSSSPPSTSTSSDPPSGSGLLDREEAHQALVALLASSDFQARRWEVLVDQQGCEASFTVVSYNLLSPSLAAREPRFRGQDYQPDPRDWGPRSRLLLDEIEALGGDIVCVQELDQPDHAGDFGDSMEELGYSSVYKKRSGRLNHGFAIFYLKARVKLIQDCPVPNPEGATGQRIDHAGILLIFEIAEGQRKQRVCVGTTHIVCDDSKGFRKLGQIVALLSAAKAQMRWSPAMPLVLTGDFNAAASSLLTEYVQAGTADLALMPASSFSKVPLSLASSHVDSEHLESARTFKVETRALRDVVPPKTFASQAEELRTMIRNRMDMKDLVVTHPLHLSSVYDSSATVDYIFHGQVMGPPRLRLVSRLELPDRLRQLWHGLPAGRFGSDHFAIAAKFHFLDEVDEVDFLDDASLRG
ncbi:hypothetical protein BGZ72_002780 [Mortierella alpina]|nr:hypothetical protein BGZ72_002780 [Mortierella alpina]